MKTKFVKETDRKGTYIIEGSFDGTFFNIKRFICQIQILYLQPIVTQYLVCNKSEIWP